MSKKLKKPLTRKRKVFKWIAISVAALLVIVIAAGGYFYWDISRKLQENSVDIGTGKTTPEPSKTLEPQLDTNSFAGAFTMLLVGNDDGNGDTAKYGERDASLNDVNILLHVSADHQNATAISIPRDLFVNMPDCVNPSTGQTNSAETDVKINQALQRGGLKCAVDAVRELTGEDIPYAAMIRFEGVVALSNAVGGVPVCVNADINDPYTGLNLTAGSHVIEGDEALAFLRTRHGVGDGSDLGRISNQQVFLSSLMRTLKSSATLSNPQKVYAIAQAVSTNMQLSTNLASLPTLASLGFMLKDIPLTNINFLQYPTTITSDNGGGVVPNTASAQAMLQAVFSDQKVVITGGTAPGDIGSVPQPATPPTPVTPTSPDTSTPTPTPTTAPEVQLPSDVTGQNATSDTCSRANS